LFRFLLLLEDLSHCIVKALFGFFQIQSGLGSCPQLEADAINERPYFQRIKSLILFRPARFFDRPAIVGAAEEFAVFSDSHQLNLNPVIMTRNDVFHIFSFKINSMQAA
jgi:hypothetical protein